jgi:hypothetical protein
VSAYSRIQTRLADLARNTAFRNAVVAVYSLAIVAFAFACYREAARIDRLLERVPEVLREADFTARNPIAAQLIEKGTVTVDGQEIGDQALAKSMERLFEGGGRLERIAEATSALVETQRRDWVPDAITQEPWLAPAGALVALGVVVFACWQGLSVQLVVVTLAASGIGAAMVAVNRPALASSLAAIPLFLFMFSVVVRLLLAALDRARPVYAVAGSVVREAMRMRIAIAFGAVAIVTIPLLPQLIDPTSPLRYQVQTYLSRSLDTMYIVCAFLTVFLGCATVAFEIRDRQAWTTLTKPVSRFSWLLGKWLGLVALNIAILFTCSVAMFVFLGQMRARPAQDLYDAIAVQDEVLVARVGGFPAFTRLTPDELQAAVEEAMKADPNIQADLRDGVRSEIEIKKALAQAIGTDYLKQQRVIGPSTERVYRFGGLSEQRKAGGNLSLRYKFYAGESDPNVVYPVIFVFGTGDRQQWIDSEFVAAQSNIVPVPASAIADDGTLEIRVQNLKLNKNAREGEPQFSDGLASFAFDPDGLELLYRVGGFNDNLLRAQLVNLVKLSFLGMLSVVCASVLSFPIACLVVFTVFSAGSIGPFLATSVAEYRIRTDSGTLKAFEAVVKAIAGATEFSVRAFGEAEANGPLVEGRLVSGTTVLRAFALIGLAWSGVLLVLGTLAFRRKELAIYSGQGG